MSGRDRRRLHGHRRRRRMRWRSVRAWPRHPGRHSTSCVVLPAEDRSVDHAARMRATTATSEDQAEAWLEAGAATASRRASPHRVHVRFAESFAEGLVAAAAELGASHIVVGAANGGLRGRHRLGSVATELLHSSDVPVVLAPEGSRRVDTSTGVTRITAAIGTRPGADVLLEEASPSPTPTGAELRLALARHGRPAAERRHGRHPHRRCRARRRGARPGARRAAGRRRRRGDRRPRRQHRRRRRSTSAGSRARWRSSARAASRSRGACSSARPLRRCFMNCPFR